MSTATFTERLQALKNKMGDATLVAVTKYATDAQLLEAYDAGLRDFGENKVQEALAKMERLPPEVSRNIRWHFIGHLQANKAKKTVAPTSGPRFHLIHSVDSQALAEKLSTLNAEAGKIQPVLLQVNIAGEESKHGFSLEGITACFESLVELPGVSLWGLMTMAPLTTDEAILENVFYGLKKLREKLAAQISNDQFSKHPFSELSMGMSNDFMHALRCGATMVRIGSYLFPRIDQVKET